MRLDITLMGRVWRLLAIHYSAADTETPAPQTLDQMCSVWPNLYRILHTMGSLSA